jgi:hypothetical protein
MMSLRDFQSALGASIRRPAVRESEGAALDAIVDSAGFRFTLDVQRSWCRGRAAKSARLTLSILDADLRERLLDTWVASGGGAASVLTAEADAFLDFIASHLPDPSHALTICRLEQATLRASAGTSAIVHFHADPDQLFAAIGTGAALPPVTAEPVVSILFAPGLDGLSRVATVDEVALWNRQRSI